MLPSAVTAIPVGSAAAKGGSMDSRSRGARALAPLFALLSALAISAALPATDWTVDITADENDPTCDPGDCSLREALAVAGNGDTIVFAPPGSPPWTIALSSALGQLVVATDVTLQGPGAADLAVSGGSARRVLSIAAGAMASISGLTLRDGRAHQSGDKHGGCIQVLGSLTLTSAHLVNCKAWYAPLDAATTGGDGGGIYVAATGQFQGDLLLLDGNNAGLGAATSSFPPAGNGSKGGRGGGLATAGAAVVRRTTFSASHAGDGGGPNGPGGEGGGVAVLSGGTLLLEESTLSGNTSGDGASFMTVFGADGRAGGIFCEGDCTLNNVTIAGNAIGATSSGSSAQGGGLAVVAGNTRLRNVTISGNTASGTGGGIARISGGTILTRHSLFANNSGASSQPDCTTSVTAGVVGNGHNFIRVNNGCASSFSGTDLEGTSALPLEPLLGTLANDAGPTETFPLQTGSPAIDAGDPVNGCLAWDPVSGTDVAMPTDQRGETRPTDGDGDAVADCDIGAYEHAGVPPVDHQMTVAVGGGGGGSVTSDPAGIACPADCDEMYAANVTVDLTRTAAPGSYFSGWSGDCTGTGACSLPMNVDRNVTASFELLRTLTVTPAGGGSGSVASTPPGIACPGDCSEEYEQTVQVDLVATPAPGSYFVGWSGDCSGAGACSLPMSVDRAVTANFALLRILDVTVVGELYGTVTSTPPGISCPGDCSEAYQQTVQVDLAAQPLAGAFFVGWSGDCSGSAGCSLPMTVDRQVTATFLPFLIFVDSFEDGSYCAWSTVVGGSDPCPP